MIIDSVAALHETPTSSPRTRRLRRLRLAIGAAAAASVLLFGLRAYQPQEPRTRVPPVAVSSLADDDPTAVNGQVAEIFGNKFVLTDPTGRALIETGRAGEGGELVAVGETVTVQGRFAHGFLHAEALIHEDGRVDELHPPHPPAKHGPKHHGPHGPGPACPGPR